jgi:large repetitive protein
VLAADVNGDGFVTGADYDMIVDDINANGARQLTGAPDFPTFFDVNGDGWITAADALAVANYLNQLNSPWQNPVLAADVNGDGFITGADYEMIVDDINENGARQLTGFP